MAVSGEQLDAYARLIVEVGCNVQPGQDFGISAYVEHAPFVHRVVREGYAAGARHVDVLYVDEQLRKTVVEVGPDGDLGYTPPWLVERRKAFDGQAYLLLRGHPDPTMFDDVDGERLARSRRQEEDAVWLRQVSDRRVNWALVSCPTEGWARTVFGEPDVDRLWEAVFRTVRLDEPDPVAAWREHTDRLEQRSALMNERRFDAQIVPIDAPTGIVDGKPTKETQRVDRDGGLREIGRVAHDGGATIRRSLVVGSRLLTVSDAGVRTSTLDTLAAVGWAPLR